MPSTYRIHPSIGIARVGDSPDEYFVGPEAPGVPPSLNRPDAPHDPNSGYKDDQGRIKRQGARFRIYEYTLDEARATMQVREVTATDAQIEWEVHLANRKAAAAKFPPRSEDEERRNDGVPESRLIIDSGPQKISGVEQQMKRLQGRFMDAVNVPLGDLLTDSAGRLIVLGGFGRSQSPSDSPLTHYANNDGWCDDVSDGPVRATIRLNDSTETIEADPAWVIVAPPDFAPAIENVVTLYDVVHDVMARLDPSLAISDATSVSFTSDIYPILRRASNMYWISLKAAGFHAPGSFGYFISRVPALQNDAAARDRIFQALRDPKDPKDGSLMPKLAANTDPTIPGVSLTQVQYERMKRWRDGEFEADWPDNGEPTPLLFDELPDMEAPHALDRAALEACVGGGFYPGIEVGRIMLEEATYDRNRPFRINAKRDPGTLTARMAVPWQADFLACGYDDELNVDWWPGQRPDQIFRSQERVDWVPSSWGSFRDMVENWSQLGIVVKEEGTDRYVEDERSLDLDNEG